jgi:hypothetical protein
MDLKQVNEALDHKITGGSEYGWACWPNARWLDYESDFAHASIVFNIETQEIYSAEINDKANKHKPYRWLNPLYSQAYIDEAKSKDVDPDKAWDDVSWYDLDVETDWLEKARAIMRSEEFDTRVLMELNLDNDVILSLAMEAHKRDITMNKMIELALQTIINKETMST